MRYFAAMGVVGLLMASAAAGAAAAAQARLTGADLQGTVADQSGAVLVGASVSVVNAETNVAISAMTDGTGRFVVAALPPGIYAVAASHPGFSTQTRQGIELSLGDLAVIDFSLRVAPTTETVAVTAEPAVVQVNRTALASVVSPQQIDTLPINGRNFISFAVITPGVGPDHTPQQGASMTSGLSFAGQRARSNNVMVDGLENNDLAVGAVRATFSQEAVREFQVLADSYSAEFGNASGGVVNIVTKSGTNGVHGNGYSYLRDKRLNAKTYFDRFDIFGNPVALEKPPYRQTQTGATLGGPLKRDRTFFFTSYERTKVSDNRVVTIEPKAAAALNAAGFPVSLGNVPLAIENSEVLGKMDHHWSPVHSLVARATYANIQREGLDDFGGTVARSRGTVQLRTDWSLAAAQTDVLTSRWLNEARAQFASHHQEVDALDPNCHGACTEPDQGGPTLELTGIGSVGRQRFTPQARRNRRVQIVDTVSYFRGSHRVKAGADYNGNWSPGSDNLLPLHFGGRYIFTAIPALGVLSALDGLQRGIPATYVQGYGNPHYPDIRYQDVSAFVQDEMIRGRFTIRSGIRYQRQFWQDAAYSVSDLGGTSFRYSFPADTNNIAPRIGVAYNLNKRTTIHGAYGVFYDNVITAIHGVGLLINGSQDGVRTLVLAAPRASIAWTAPGHRLAEPQAVALLGSSYPSVAISPDPALKNSFTRQASVGLDKILGEDFTAAVNGVFVRGFNLIGTLDYNPILPTALGPNRRPDDLPCSANIAATCIGGGIPGTSASVLQYTAFGESWYKGLTVSLSKRLSHRHQFLVSYTLSTAEDTSTDFQSNSIVQNSGLGRNQADRSGLPLGFDPRSERGPATHDQRHRLVVSGVYQLPRQLAASAIVTAASGRPFTPLAGADLNGDGNGGAFPPDRARVNPLDEATSVGRNSQTTASQFSVDARVSRKFRLPRDAAIEGIVEVFNLFNRMNFIEDTNQSSFAIFGTGAYPSSPLPTYGRYTLTLPPRQAQIAVRVTF